MPFWGFNYSKVANIDSWSIPILFVWIWELPNFSIFWTRSGPWLPVFLMKILQKIQEKIGNHFRKSLSFHISTFWNFICLTFFGPITPICVVSYFRKYPNKIRMTNRILGVFVMEYFSTIHNFDKMRNHKQIVMKSKYFLKSMDYVSITRNVVESWYFDIFPEKILWLICCWVFFGGMILNDP